MAWRFDNPLYTLTTDEQNEDAKNLWEGESLGGIKENNNRLPPPVVGLLVLTIITAFLITFPLWGQRPTAAIYEEYVALMDDPAVQAISDDDKKVEYIVDKVKASGSKWAPLQERHPVEWDDLLLLKPQIEELKRKGAPLAEYNVLGDKIILANFEGNKRPDGSTMRVQPWWDLGYTIDIFFIVVFCVSVVIAVKRLPNYSYLPDHTKHH
jgi:hypothetical protein